GDGQGMAAAERAAFCNRLIDLAARLLEKDGLDRDTAERLRGAMIGEEALQLLEVSRGALVASESAIKPGVRPATSIAMSTLFTGDTREPNMLAELRKEIATSDRIDFLVSFVKFSGIRLVLDELRLFANR